MPAFITACKQIAMIAIVLVIAYCVSVTVQRPGRHAANRAEWCAGYSFGWAHEYCAQGGDCKRAAPPCPENIPSVRGSSLSAGVDAGVYYADEALSLIYERDPPDYEDRPYGY